MVRGALRLEAGDGPGAEQALNRAYAAAVDSKDMPILAAVAVAAVAALYGRYRDMAARLRGARMTRPIRRSVRSVAAAEPNWATRASPQSTKKAGSWPR